MKGAFGVVNPQAGQPQGAFDWWQNRLQQMPNANGLFQDNIFQMPPDRNTHDLNFDAMGAHEQPLYQEWVANRLRQMAQPPRFK
jgi:hypothetical protein